MRRVDHAGTEGVGQAQSLDAALACACHFHQRHFALDAGRVARQVHNLMNRHKPFKLRLDLLNHHRRRRGDNGDARRMSRIVHLGHRQALDIIAAARKQPDNARENPRLVVHEDGDCMPFDVLLGAHARLCIGIKGGCEGFSV